jgi:riboflavin-specific deaminase-like protein
VRRLLPEPDRPDVDLDEAYPWPDDDHLRALFITSADGAATADGRSGPLGNDSDRSLLTALRRSCDAVLVGAGTVRTEGYRGLRFDDDVRRRRTAAGLSATPPLVILSRRVEFDPTASIFVDTNTAPIIVTTESAVAAAERNLGGLADIVAVGSDRVDLRQAVDALHERGLRHLLCEGGPRLLAQLLAADLVDELCLTIAPALVGAGAGRIVVGDDGFDQMRRMRLADLFRDGDDYLFARYTLR